jgi:hypothetical protein
MSAKISRMDLGRLMHCNFLEGVHCSIVANVNFNAVVSVDGCGETNAVI